MLTNHLVKLGLNQGEAKVYIALLNNGDSTATELSSKTGLGRTNIYNYAKTLQEKGLISDFERNSKVFFQATDPKELYSMLDSRKKELSNLSLEHLNLLPRFEKLFHQQGKTPNVRLYMGKKDWKKLMKTIYLDHQSKEMYILVPDLDNYQPPSPVYQSSLYTNKVFTYLITNKSSDIGSFKRRDERKLRKTLEITRTLLPIDQESVIFGNVIYTGSFNSDDLQVYSVEDKMIVKLLLSLIKTLINLQQ